MYPDKTESSSGGSWGAQYSSCLIAHNFYNRGSEFYEITRPFLILYEQVHISPFQMTLLEISDSFLRSSRLPYRDRMLNRPLHSHLFYELTFVLSGELHMTIEDQNITLYPGDCCICGLSTKHREDNTSDSEAILFMLQPDFLHTLLKGEEEDPLYQPDRFSAMLKNLLSEECQSGRYFASEKNYLIFRAHSDGAGLTDRYTQLFNQLVMTSQNGEAGKIYFMKGLLCRFLALLSDETAYDVSTFRQTTSVAEDIFIQASLMIEASLGRITRTKLAEQIGYSSNYIARIIENTQI